MRFCRLMGHRPNTLDLISYLQIMDTSDSLIPAAEPLTSQVGGHKGVLATEGGALIIKPTLPLELEFYQRLQHDPRLSLLRPFTPKFLGTLRLEGKLAEDGSLEGNGIKVMPVDVPEKDQFQT